MTAALASLIRDFRVKIVPLPSLTTLLVLSIVVFQGTFSILLVVDWRHGIARGIILGSILLELLALRALPIPTRTSPARTSPARAHLSRWAWAALIVLVSFDLGIAGYTFLRSMHTHRIPMDQGQTTWRAARLLLQGENPYGSGAVVDFTALADRAPARLAAGLPPSAPITQDSDVLLRYDQTLDPQIRQQLLPVPPAVQMTAAGARELTMGGYKYGPIILLVTTPVAAFGLPAAVVLLNAGACFGLFAVGWRLLRSAAISAGFAALGLAALLLDRHITWNYLNETATDIWALLFISVAVLGYTTRRPWLVAGALAAAIGCKIFPSLLFLPLLLRLGTWRPIGVFAAVLLAIYLPWLVWDPAGLVGNVFLWPAVMYADNTSWIYYAPEWLALPGRLIVFGLIGFAWWRYLAGRETRLFWTLALVNTLVLLSGAGLHNNYVPWSSVWIVLAVVEAFSPMGNRADNASAEISPRHRLRGAH